MKKQKEKFNYEEFEKDQQKVLNEIYDWLNLTPSKINNLTPQKTGDIRLEKLFFFINSSGLLKSCLKLIFSKTSRIKIRSFFYLLFVKKKKKSDISNSTKELLIHFYKEDVFRLEKLLNKDLSFWLNI